MIHNEETTQMKKTEFDEQIGGYVSAIRAEQLTEDDYQKMETNLQQSIISANESEELSADVPSSQNIRLLEQLKLQLLRAFHWKPFVLASSMGVFMTALITLFFMGTSSNNAFAAVLSEMKLVSSMFYSSRIESNGQPLMNLKVYYREPGNLRVETLPIGKDLSGSVINVMDLLEGKGVIFFPAMKVATPFSFDVENNLPLAETDPLYWYEQLKNYQGEPAEYLAAREINGVLAEGFVIKENGANVTVWAGSDNHLPVKLIVTLDKVKNQTPFKMVADLKYNQTFDNALFSLEIGKDYNVSTVDGDQH